LLSKLLTQGVGNLTAEEYQGQIKDLQDKVEKLENKVSQISAEFRTQSQAITLEAVQTAIPQNATLIEFATYQPYDFKTDNRSTPRYVVYMLNNSGKIEWVELGETSDIDKLVEDFRQTLIKRPGGLLSDIEQELKPKARALDKAIMQPVRKLLGKNKRLLIAPDGNLNLIPFDALVDEQGKYLVEHYEVSYLTSGRDLLRLQNGIKSEQKPLVMADPNYGEGEGTKIGELVVAGNRLKYTALEANEIKQILNLQPSELLLQDQATKFALKQIHRPEILHIATHGFFLKEQEGSDDSRRTKVKRVGLQPEPEVKQVAVDAFKLSPLLKSGLLLAGANKGDSDNGVLTALDATSLDLWGTKLVVLSACDTAVGEVKNGDGVYGLRRALVLAGSESQLMSLWQVSDVGTRDLMTQYYQALKNNEGRSAGLRKVRLKLLKSAKRHHPYYWASFIQSGEWANLNGKR
jgi:CHAT domain-containing protein